MADSGARHTVALHDCWAYNACAESDDCAKPKAATAAAPAEWRPDPDTDLVLSDVHIGRAPSAAQRCTTVFRFRAHRHAPAGCDSGSGGNGSCDHPDGVSGSSRGGCVFKNDLQPVAALPLSGAAPAELDEDGDVVVKRRRTTNGAATAAAEGGMGGSVADGIVMHHAMATSLHSVGKQVWRGSLLLADLLLSRPQLVAGRTVVELGAGCGLAGIAAARAGAGRVLLTDLPSLTPQLQENIAANAAHCATGAVTAHCLDWTALPPVAPPQAGHCRAAGPPSAACALQRWADAHGWSPADLRHLLQAQVLLAADTVYDDDLTESFMAAAAALLQPHATCADSGCSICNLLQRQQTGCTRLNSNGGGSGCGTGSRKRMYVALEKRYNFTLRNMDTRASAYEHWLELFDSRPHKPVARAAVGGGTASRPTGGPASLANGINSSAYSSVSSDATGKSFSSLSRLPLAGRRLEVASVQHVLDYERGNDLELWELWAEEQM